MKKTNRFNNATTIKVLKAMYREAIKKAHPDNHGSNEQFISVRNDYLEQLAKLMTDAIKEANTIKEDTPEDVKEAKEAKVKETFKAFEDVIENTNDFIYAMHHNPIVCLNIASALIQKQVNKLFYPWLSLFNFYSQDRDIATNYVAMELYTMCEQNNNVSFREILSYKTKEDRYTIVDEYGRTVITKKDGTPRTFKSLKKLYKYLNTSEEALLPYGYTVTSITIDVYNSTVMKLLKQLHDKEYALHQTDNQKVENVPFSTVLSDDYTIEDVLPDRHNTEQEAITQYRLSECYNTASSGVADIMYLYQIGYTFEEIAKIKGITKSGVNMSLKRLSKQIKNR